MATDAPSTQTLKLSSLADWSRQHIRDVFEAPSNALTLQALDSTFSRALEATVNGEPCNFDGFAKMIAGMAEHAAPGGPRVDWVFADETPDVDDRGQNRNGVVKGEYYIRGIYGKIPGAEAPVEIEARKQVVGRIESQSSEAGVDSRHIVKLDAIVNILPVYRSSVSS